MRRQLLRCGGNIDLEITQFLREDGTPEPYPARSTGNDYTNHKGEGQATVAKMKPGLKPLSQCCEDEGSDLAGKKQ
jgi:hypothetical protein